MKNRTWVLLLALSFTVLNADESTEAKIEGSYFAVIVNDVEASRNWCQTVLGLEQVSRSTERDRFDIINMAGPGLFVELLELRAAATRPGGQI